MGTAIDCCDNGSGLCGVLNTVSDGKSFANKKDLTDAQRFEELERKYTVVQERIQVYDRIVEENRVLTKRLNELADKPREIHERVSSLTNVTTGRLQSHETMIAAQISANSDLRKAQQGFQISLEHSRETQIANAKFSERSLNELENRLIAYCNGKMDVKDFKDFKEEYYRDYALNLEDINKVRAAVVDCKSCLTDLNQVIKDAKTVINEQGKGITGIKLWLNGLEEKLSSAMSDKMQDFTSKQSDAYDGLRKEVAANKQELLGTPSSNASIERRIMNRLEMATLDGNNAVAMSKNHEEKIKILEKKLEALNAQLTKYEIK